MKVLGMSEPVPLEAIYTTAEFLSTDDIRVFETVEALEHYYRQSNRRSFAKIGKNRRGGIDIANAEQYLTVLGGPGAGKSTFLRKIGLEALKGKHGKFEHSCIPIFLELKRFDSNELDVEQLLISEFEISGFPDPNAFTRNALKQGRLLVLLDGLDEVPLQNLDQIIFKIQDFLDQYANNRFILSCRTAAYHGYFKRCKDIAISEFGETQIKQFIYNWFHSNLDQQSNTAQKCWETLKNPNNVSAMELAHTPLLLTFLCLIYNRSQHLPTNRSTLYRKALDILLEEWAAEKRIMRDMIYEGLHIELEKALLSEIAYNKFAADKLFFSRQELINQITSFLRNTLNAPKQLDGRAVLHAIEIQQGVLVERAEGVYSFSHLTIQEYLTAAYIANHQTTSQLIVKEHLTDKRWREIFLLISGLKGDVSSFLLLIEERARQCVKSSRLKGILFRVIHVRNEFSANVKPSVKRALAILYFLAFRSDSAVNFIQLLDPRFTRKTFSNLNSAPKSKKIALSNQEIEELNNYFYTHSLLIECKNSAIRLSPKTWENIEARLLLIEPVPNSKALESAQRFFEQVGATVISKNRYALEITKIPKGYQLSTPISILIAIDQPVDQVVSTLIPNSAHEFEKKSEKTGILLYQKTPNTIGRIRIAEVRLHGHVLVPIPLAEVENALPENALCESILSEYVSRYVQRADFFDDRNAISDTLAFFGRTELLNRLREELLRYQGIGLFGLRKSGKTSVLYQLGFLLREHPVIHIDLQRYSGENYGADLFNEIIQQLCSLARDRISDNAPQFQKFKSGTPATELTVEFVKRMCELADSLQVAEYRQPILCFLDEVERILPTSKDSRKKVEEFNAFFGSLRVLSQEQRKLAILISDVYPDCNRINHWWQEEVPTNPVFSFFKEVFLSPFPEQETIQMLTSISNLMGINLDKNKATQIHAESGGHPYISRQLARLTIQNQINEENRLILENDWDELLLDFDELSNYFEKSIWEDLEKRGLHSAIMILQIIVANNLEVDWIDENFLHKELSQHIVKQQLMKSLNWLVSVGLLERKEDKSIRTFRLKILHLSRWIRMNMSEEEILKWRIK
ncbi:MAG: NACHT domain-containing protein [Cyanothece sp. SIO1E1]|nr:NACHT domain-containing protein [Cyanothece sp. SIO1E1]